VPNKHRNHTSPTSFEHAFVYLYLVIIACTEQYISGLRKLHLAQGVAAAAVIIDAACS